MLWCIQRERNQRTFEDVESLGDQLLASFIGYWFDWSRAWGLTSCDSIPLFFSSLLFCFSHLNFVPFDYYVLFLHIVVSLIYFFLPIQKKKSIPLCS